jgi:hypothetical protein
MRRPFPYYLIATFSALYFVILTGIALASNDLVVRLVSLIGAGTAGWAALGVWRGVTDAPRRIVCLGLVLAAVALAVFLYAKAFWVANSVAALLNGSVVAILGFGGSAYYVHRRRWTPGEGSR